MKKTIKLALVAAASVAVISTTAAKESQPGPLSHTATVTPLGIYFDIDHKGLGASLRVSGPNDFFYEQQYAAGEQYDFPLAGLAWEDGLYSFELVSVPNTAVTKVARTEPLAGSFTMINGMAADPALLEGGFRKDIVQNDDVINTFSLCVGNDCVNGESFGFDTVRLKENNLRVHFDDTSTSASFPSNDWRLVVNDTANGGAAFMAIEDSTAGRQVFRVDAGAPASSLHVDSAGDVGIGTSNAVVELHVVDGDSPTLRLEQNGSSGFTPQTFDLVSNEANFFIRDVTNGSQLPFRIKPGADTDSLVIAANNDIGIGTDNPVSGSGADRLVEIREAAGSTSMTLDYNGANKFGEFTFEENNAAMWGAGAVSNSDFFYVYNYGRNANDLVIRDSDGNLGLGGVTNPANPIQHSNGAILSGTGMWQNASSRALKHEIRSLSGTAALKALREMIPVTFRYNQDPTDQVVGFIAEDVPELVATKSRATLSAMDITAVLTKVVQDQQETIDRLEARLAELERK